MDTFHERKAKRKKYYENYIKGWKQRKCCACNGSGYYDSDGSPPCGACDGTGKETYRPQDSEATESPSEAGGIEEWMECPECGATAKVPKK